MLLTILPLLLAGATAAAGPTNGVTIRLGDSVIFRLDHGLPVDTRPARPGDTPNPDELMVSLQSGNGTGTILVLRNGMVTWLNYRAFISRDGGPATPTDVCTLMNSGRTNIEQWPYAISSIRLDAFTAAPVGQMTCR